jgi:hypothetical protein
MVQHRYLTDVDKHEPYGIEDAQDGQVFVADGVGGGAWEDVNSSIPGIIIQDQIAWDGDASATTEDAWSTRSLSTEVRNAITGASLASSVITLPAGTYYVEWWARFRDWGLVRTRLRDTTAGSTLAWGTTERIDVEDEYSLGERDSKGVAYFTLSTTSNLEIQYYLSDGNFDGQGGEYEYDSGDSAVEINAQVLIFRDVAG